MKSYPKIWALGHKYISTIFSHDVEITEKVDGSQFAFGWDADGVFHCRSKGVMIDHEDVSGMFLPVVEWALSLPAQSDTVFYGETLSKPKHNSLCYERIPTNHFALFGAANFAGDEHLHDHARLSALAEDLGCDVVPLLYRGRADFSMIETLLHSVSYLGGVDAEGVVVKAAQDYMMCGMYVPIMAGKFVTEKFKEVHSQNPEFKTSKSKTEMLFEQYRTEARWEKAVQFLKETDQFLGEPKDIGKLLKRVNEDLDTECKEEIKDKLWSVFRKDFLSSSTRGLPEWYKTSLAKGELDG